MAWVYLETKPESGEFNCRGELGENDNPDSFKRMMERANLRVIVTKNQVGVPAGTTGLARGVPLAALRKAAK